MILHVGSQKEGTREIRGLMDKCHGALHNVDLVLDGISGDAGSSFRDEAIAEATKIKDRLNNVNTDL